MGTVEDIKAKIDLADYLREQGLQLKQAGSSLKACCPFHNEKSASFMVHREKQVWHCFGCFPPGTLVKTSRGFHRIDLLGIGEHVTGGSCRDRRITQTHEHAFDGDLIGVRTRKLGGMVFMTPDHHVPVVRGAPSTRSYKVFTRRLRRYLALPNEQRDRKLRHYFPVVELPAEQLRTGDLVMYPIADNIRIPASVDIEALVHTRARKGPKPPPLPRHLTVNDDLLRLVGLWVAEGSTHRAYIRWSFGPTEMSFAKEVQGICQRLFGLPVGIHERRGRNGIEVTCCHAYLAQAIGVWCGKGAEFKHVPFEFQCLPHDQQRVLLDALCDGDGTDFIPHRSTHRHRSYTTISRTLAEQVVDIVLRLGYFPTLSVQGSSTDANGVHHRDAFTVAWSEEARQRYDSVIERGGTRYWLLPITHIERKPYRGPVYNLTVADDHSYVASNFMVANCGRGGDLFTFVQEREGLEFGEALKLLADRAGVKLEAHDPRLEGQRTRSLGVLELAAKWFRHQLEKMPVGEVARQYVATRKIAPDIAEQFQIGYAPDAWDGLTSFLLSRKFTPQEIIAAGLGIESRKPQAISNKPSNVEPTASGLQPTARIYDRFRHRLMFPIHDALGRVMGFTGRILEGGKTVGPVGETPAKYVNTPETALYKKGAILYGLWRARDAIRAAGYAVLVEGQMDVVACHEARVAQTVAASGTALTSEQLKLFKRYTTTLHVAFDADPAGEGAAERGIDAALDAGFDVRVIRMPTDAQGKPIAKDADECIRKDADAWRTAVAHPTPVLDYFIERVCARFDLRQPAGQRDAGRVLVAHLAHIADPIERAAWVRRTADAIGVPEAAITEAIVRMRASGAVASAVAVAPAASPTSGDPITRAADRLLAMLLRDRSIIADVAPLVGAVDAFGEGYAELYNMLRLAYSGQREDPLPDNGFIARLLLLADQEFAEWGQEALRAEAITCARVIRRAEIDRQLKGIEHAFRTAPAHEHEDLARRFEALHHEKKDME